MDENVVVTLHDVQTIKIDFKLIDNYPKSKSIDNKDPNKF